MRILLNQEPDLDAVFACNDQMALGALGVLHQMGRRIPQDIAIVGFDNTPESAFYLPPLTTVYQHLVEAGHLAVQKLHQLVQARRKNENEVGLASSLLTPELVVRASSAQPESNSAILLTTHTNSSLR